MKPRACLSCYHRKIKCDRKQPCNNCVDSHESCSFPGKIRRNRPRRKAVEAPLIEKRFVISETRPEELGKTTSGSSMTEDHEYMVVDNTGQSRLLASNAWANVKEEVSGLHKFQSFHGTNISQGTYLQRHSSQYPPRECINAWTRAVLVQCRPRPSLGRVDPQFGSIRGLLAHLSGRH
jgi:hypothetical protein